MNLLIDDVNEFIDFLHTHKLTADQFVFCLLLSSESEDYRGLPDKEKAMSNFFKYYSNVASNKENPVWAQQDLDELVEKGFIERMTGVSEESYEYDKFEITDKFLDLVFEKKGSLMDNFSDFWSTYPAFYENKDGQKFNIKAVNKEDVFDDYRKAVRDVEPDELLHALKVAKSKDEVNCRIDKWLNSHMWEAYMGEESTEAQDIEQTVL